MLVFRGLSMQFGRMGVMLLCRGVLICSGATCRLVILLS